MNKVNVSIRLTPEARQRLKDLAQELGISQAAIIEIAIRLLEKKLLQEKRK